MDKYDVDISSLDSASPRHHKNMNVNLKIFKPSIYSDSKLLQLLPHPVCFVKIAVPPCGLTFIDHLLDVFLVITTASLAPAPGAAAGV